MWPIVLSSLVLLSPIFIMVSAQNTPHVLVYTATKGYRHDSIGTAIEVLGQQGPQWNVSFTFSEYVFQSTHPEELVSRTDIDARAGEG